MNNEFYALVKQYEGSYSWSSSNDEWGYYYNSSNMRSAPLNFVLSGYHSYLSASMYYNYRDGIWWSSTVYSSDNAYKMDMTYDRVTPRLVDNRRFGFSVRCLAREPKTIGSIEYMQDITPEHCANSTEHQVATLKDKRDNNTYIVAKLKDGKCWMTQNLRLKLDTSTPLKPENSDVTQNWTPNRSTDTASCQRGTRWDQDSEGHKTVRSCYQSESTYNTNGVYYTHTAATAGTTANMNHNDDEATGSICPKGWRLPKARDTSSEPANNDFYQMAKHYVNSNMTWNTNNGYGHWNSDTHNLLSSPQNFIYSGLRWHDADGVARLGSYGFWWSSTVLSSNNACHLYVDSGSVHPRNSRYRSIGFTVRCIAR